VIPDLGRLLMLIGVRPSSDSGRVKTRLVGERRPSDIWAVSIERNVDDFGNVMSDRRQQGKRE